MPGDFWGRNRMLDCLCGKTEPNNTHRSTQCPYECSTEWCVPTSPIKIRILIEKGKTCVVRQVMSVHLFFMFRYN